jgi:hypothetical protein
MKEYELQQMQAHYGYTPYLNNPQLNPSTLTRRYSEEVKYAYPTQILTNKPTTKHRASFDSYIQPLPPPSVPLKNITEESPEQKDNALIGDKALFDIFSSASENSQGNLLFFTPSKQSKSIDKTQGLSPIAISNSCPATPVIKRQSYKKAEIFRKMHGDPEGKKPDNGNDLLDLDNLLKSIGLEKLLPLFAKRDLMVNDLFILTKEDYKEIGILDETDIDKLMAKVKEFLEKNAEEQLNSPSIENMID